MQIGGKPDAAQELKRRRAFAEAAVIAARYRVIPAQLDAAVQVSLNHPRSMTFKGTDVPVRGASELREAVLSRNELRLCTSAGKTLISVLAGFLHLFFDNSAESASTPDRANGVVYQGDPKPQPRTDRILYVIAPLEGTDAWANTIRRVASVFCDLHEPAGKMRFVINPGPSASLSGDDFKDGGFVVVLFTSPTATRRADEFHSGFVVDMLLVDESHTRALRSLVSIEYPTRAVYISADRDGGYSYTHCWQLSDYYTQTVVPFLSELPDTTTGQQCMELLGQKVRDTLTMQLAVLLFSSAAHQLVLPHTHLALTKSVRALSRRVFELKFKVLSSGLVTEDQAAFATQPLEMLAGSIAERTGLLLDVRDLGTKTSARVDVAALKEKLVLHKEGLEELEKTTPGKAGAALYRQAENVKAILSKLGQEEDTCGVCQEDLVTKSVVLMPCCLAVYHDDCSSTWLDTRNTCMNCRARVFTGLRDAVSYDDDSVEPPKPNKEHTIRQHMQALAQYMENKDSFPLVLHALIRSLVSYAKMKGVMMRVLVVTRTETAVARFKQIHEQQDASFELSCLFTRGTKEGPATVLGESRKRKHFEEYAVQGGGVHFIMTTQVNKSTNTTDGLHFDNLDGVIAIGDNVGNHQARGRVGRMHSDPRVDVNLLPEQFYLHVFSSRA